jgi:glycosyltransferase involved in cell wall biosynthesis
MKISAVIITLNEEGNLKRCLNSVAHLVDEIIIVDSFSTDLTKSIAESFNATFIQRNWEGYSKTKNFANALVNSDYILSLDADESLDQELQESIKALKSRQQTETYFRLNRKNYLLGKWVRYGGWYPDLKIRLFPKNSAQWQGEHVHEQLHCRNAYPIVDLNGHIDHFTANTDGEHWHTISKYSKLRAQEIIDKNQLYGPIKSIGQVISTFIRTYIIKLGVLDGRLGWKVASRSAYSRWMRYQFYRELKIKQRSGAQ